MDSEYCEALKGRRHFLIHSLKNFGFGKRSLGSLMQEEVDHTVSVFLSQNDQPFDPKPHLHVAVANVICSLLFGKRFSRDDESFSHVLFSVNKLFGTWIENPAGDYIPVMRMSRPYRKTIQAFTSYGKVILDFIRDQLREHRATFDPDHLRDVMDACINEMLHGDKKVIDELQTLYTLLDFFTAGSDTITVTLQWMLLYLVNRPEVQRKIQTELETVLERTNATTIKLEDRAKLPYTEAVIMETQRFASILPISVGRDTPNATNFKGFTLPKRLWVTFLNFCLMLTSIYSVT